MAILVANRTEKVGVDQAKQQQDVSSSNDEYSPKDVATPSREGRRSVFTSLGLLLVCTLLLYLCWNAEISREEVLAEDYSAAVITTTIDQQQQQQQQQHRRLVKSLPQTVVIKAKKADPKKYAVQAKTAPKQSSSQSNAMKAQYGNSATLSTVPVVKVVHVFNPYVVKNNQTCPTCYPLDLNQWAAMASIERAQKYLPPGMEVEIVCAILESDREALDYLPCRKVTLHRSVKTEYPSIQPPMQLTFIQDMFDMLNTTTSTSSRTSAKQEENVFLMFTNSDIGLTRDFYTFLGEHLTKYEPLNINRNTIPMENLTTLDTMDGSNKSASSSFSDEYSSTFLSQVDSLLPHAKEHPGSDCFVIHSSVLQRIHLGNMFVGHAPWGMALNIMLDFMADNYMVFKSPNVRGTFHLGDDKSWLSSGYSPPKDRGVARYCPKLQKVFDPHAMQNYINCGKSFQPKNMTVSFPNQYIPTYVQPGHEARYLARLPSSLYIKVSKEGYPIKLKEKEKNQRIERREKKLEKEAARKEWNQAKRQTGKQ